ncbi:MAG TPA: three-Cys-motif partner protein TcmP [Trebonia sp.]|nr:three-Cys-motif partner protein TcmP [Trebonia sp.]
MATGTAGGLLDSNDHAQSSFKHAIIRHYVLPYVAMTGSTSKDHRVAVMDGFAGRGRFKDLSPGSAELIMQAVETLQRSRTVDMFFAETDPDNYRALSAVVQEYADKGLSARTLPGSAEEHLETVVAAARGIPLFLFLDPCGALVPFPKLARLLGSDRRSKWPPTEILMNFSADFTRRAAGQLAAERSNEGGVVRMDATCGGTWWREVAMSAYRSSPRDNFETAAEEVVGRYAERLIRESGMSAITVPVRRRLHHQPVYHLVFLTRSPYGIWVFADALGHARREWLRMIGRLDDDRNVQETFPGMSRSDDMQQLIAYEQDSAQKIVEANLIKLARPGQAPVRLVDHARQVFGDAYGIATDSVVSDAIAALETRGELTVPGPATRVRNRVIGPPGQDSQGGVRRR